MKMPVFDYVAPRSLPEALGILSSRRGDARVLAGGQSLLPLLAFRMAAPGILVDLRQVPDLDRIRISPEAVTLGAMVRWCDIEESPMLATAQPLLAAAIAHVAHYPIRSRGTVGGSLAHADFAAELPGIAVVCDAEIVAVSIAGTRRIPARQLFDSPLTTTLREDEVITALVLAQWPRTRRWGFREFSRQRGGFPLAGVAVHYDHLGEAVRDAHFTVIAAHARLERLSAVESALNGRPLTQATIDTAAEAAAQAIDPVGDVEGSPEYRRALVRTLAARALRDSVERKAGEP